MSSVIQTKTDQVIRTLTPEQLAEYAVREKWIDLKDIWEKKITEQDGQDKAAAFNRKFLDPMPWGEYKTFRDSYCRLNRAEETRTSISVSFGLMSDTIVMGQGLLHAIDRLIDVAYTVQEGRTPWPEDLEYTLAFSERILIPAMILLERTKGNLRTLLEEFPDFVTFPPEQELVKTPQEVRDYMAAKELGEEYTSDLTDPYDMPRIHLAKHLGVETEGRTYREISKSIRDTFHNIDKWEEDQDGEPVTVFVTPQDN